MAEYYEKVQYSEQPEPVRYRPRPDGKADVWIRHDIRQEEQEEGVIWLAREVYLQTVQSQAEIEAEAPRIFLRESGIQKRLTDAVQGWMDRRAQERGYDNIASACSYIQSTDTVFQAEAEVCVAWRDRVWRYCYNVLDEVMAARRTIPTAEELLAELDAELPLVWPEAA